MFLITDTITTTTLVCGQNHQCQDNCEIVLGDAHQGYGHIQQALERYKVGNLVNAIILNPSHPDPLKLAI